MENSFSDYRNKTEVESDSDTEFIDNSFVEEITYSVKKKNRTIFVPESEESATDEESTNDNAHSFTLLTGVGQSNTAEHVTPRDKDPHRSICRTSDVHTVVLSSSDEGDVSPEILPKRPPSLKIKQNVSILRQRNKKRLRLLDSDTDNSIIIDNNKNKKLPCLKDTPLKIESGDQQDKNDVSMEYGTNDETTSLGDETQNDESEIESDDGIINEKVSRASNSEVDDNVSDEADEEDSADESNDAENSSSTGKLIRKDCRNKLNFSDSENSDENNSKHSTINNSNASYKSLSGQDVKKNHIKHINDSTDDESESMKISFKNTNKNRKKVINSDTSSDGEDHTATPVTSSKKTNINNSKKIIKGIPENDMESSTENDSDKNVEAHTSLNKFKENVEIGDDNDKQDDESDDGPNEDLMVMSRATRMSIMGVVPKGNDSDESDFIESDSSHRKSYNSTSTNDQIEHAETSNDNSRPITPVKIPENLDNDMSRLSCSPFSSPFCDITNMPSVNEKKDDVIDLMDYKPNAVRNKDRSGLKIKKENCIRYNDDVTIIESNPEIITLSSDDEDSVLEENKSPNMKKSPRMKKSPKPKAEVPKDTAKDNTMKAYLLPPSYPNQIRYVNANEKQKQFQKLEGLRVDLANVHALLGELNLDQFPDGGKTLLERASALKVRIRQEEDKVANMVVASEPETNIKTDKRITTWDDLQKASNEVQPRMFGKQAMATHMAERSLILDSLRHLHESLASCPQESELAKQPGDVRTKLMGHQLHALAWLKWRETQRPTGGILADDMGLGKTITMISLIVSDKENNIDYKSNDERVGNKPPGGTLVVCPASLIQQWESEVQKHCSRYALTVCLHHGAARAQQPHPLAAYDLVLTTYNIVQRDNEKNGVLMRVNWRRVILDEAHIVRNHKSATSAGVSALVARRRWCLTGTPVQNKDLDLFALLKFLKCTPFDELTMWKKWIDNKSLGGQERLNTVMRCILLRRTKAQLQAKGELDCLPERHIHQEHVALTKAEMNVYQKVLVMSKTLFAQFLHQRAEKNSVSVGFVPPEKDSEYTKMHKKMVALKGVKLVKSHEILVLLLRLRQVCCHCGLIGSVLQDETVRDLAPESGSNDLLDELNRLTLEDSKNKRKSAIANLENEPEEDAGETASVAEAIKSVLMNNDPVFDMCKPSSKIKAVMDCLKENVFKNKGDKAVVVSQWTGVLRLVEEQLRNANVKNVTLNGSVSVPARQALVNAVNDPNSDVKVMLLSLSAGGVGLNLCGANHLLLLDPHWNPQLEEQARDRIYRVGQKKPVHIYRFMCVDTVEQSIRNLQTVKLELAENVLTGAKNTNASKLSIEDLKMLFNMG
ncbi:hypothetical protein K1T71_010620 [Dendrolimus kikuchii]|uniref:Uncharacterized protein n=1 Tax=Dendrolimus kikuchii TaxID=765133 RepID=A0ACC1CPM7_9NEOP|nr:hypothetical protein K1T71_010620 [Dendrolimus kikuchii]